ncbi:ATP-binding protein [Desulfovibrio sp. OttesenSCG-928-F20]|nr:ATP-binding protein [Desulfovibrio sp. OttesenSCG-928-F20]
MTAPAIKLTDNEYLGKVSAVDTNKVVIIVDDHDKMTKICVGNLVAIQGTLTSEYLIGIIDRATRSTVEKMFMDDQDDNDSTFDISESQQDLIKVVLIGTYRTVDGERRNTFKRGADSFPQIDKRCYQLTANNLQNFMNILSADVPEEERMTLGQYIADKKATAIANGDKFFQRHAAILGSTGSGKSWTVTLILEKAANLIYSNMIVLDMHGEYSPLCDAKAGFAEQFKIAGPGDLNGDKENTLFLPYWTLNREEMLAMILDRSDSNAPNQASRFTEHVRQLKGETLSVLGRNDVLETFTVDSPIFYDLHALTERLKQDNIERKLNEETKKMNNGEWNGKLTRFIARLESKIEDRRYGFLFQPPEETQSYEWLAKMIGSLFNTGKGKRGIKIIDFSEVPFDVLPIVVGVFARIIYNIQFWMTNTERHPITFVCDEAHLYLPVKDDADASEKRALEAFERIAKEGRKYGVSLLVVSQRPSDVSRTILSQCNNFLVLRLTNDQDQNVVKRLVPDSMVGLTDILPLLDTGEALLFGDSILLPTRIKVDIPKLKPDSATRKFWTDWSRQEPIKDAVLKAIETMRKQTR